MKRILLMSGVLLLLSTVFTNNAQGARRLTFFVAPEIGFVAAPEDVAEYYQMGFGAALGFEYSFSSKLSLVWTANYKSFSPDMDLILNEFTGPDEYPNATNISIEDGTIYVAVVSVLAKAKLKGAGSSFWPYVKGGFGLSVVGADEIVINFMDGGGTPMTEYNLGLDLITAPSVLAAFGLELKRGGSGSFFVEVGFEIHYLENEEGDFNLTTVPIRLGFSF